MIMSRLTSLVVAVVTSLSLAGTARAIPAFARKYGTSCQTCHTVYPRLSPFGEAFRRNGFRFPGKDGDFVKQETVPLGQDAYKDVFPKAVWPGIIPDSVPLAVGFNGQAVIHPDRNSAAAVADNHSVITFNDLIAEGHIWTGGSFGEKVTYFGEVTFSSDGTIDVEHAQLHWNDIVGPKHLLNLRIGRGFSTITSFGPHSSYVADAIMPSMPVTALNGGTTSSWNVLDHYNGLELTGMVAGRFDYAIGVNAGANADIRPSENFYAHIGGKIGGMRLDGEGDSTGNPEKPWAETAATIDLFGYRAVSHYIGADTAPQDDTAWLLGANVRLQLSSLELNAGWYQEWHDRAVINDAGDHAVSVTAWAQYDELSYIVFPWLVPAIRFEYLSMSGDASNSILRNGIHDFRIMPGVAFLVKPNVKFLLVGQIEQANGAPIGGWGAVGGFASPMPGIATTEIESISASFAFAL
jgi:hypothetical protein